MMWHRITNSGLWVALLLFALSPVSWGQEETLEDIVAELDMRLSAVECENQQLRRLLNASGLTSDLSHTTHGRVHVDYWTYPGDSPGVNAFESGDSTITPQDALELRRARVERTGKLPGTMYYALDFELSEASEPEFRDMYIGWDELPLFGKLVFGNQKRPYGLEHLNSSNFNVFLERTFVNQAFNRNNRRFGLASYHHSDNGAWNWRYGIFNLRELQTDGLYVSDHYQPEFVGRVAHTLFDPYDESLYIHTGLAASHAIPDGLPEPGREENQARFRTEPEARTQSQWLDTGIIDGADRYNIVGLEGVVNYRRLQVTAEYMNLWMSRMQGFGGDLHFDGAYLQVAYFLTDHFQPWQRDQGIIGRVQMLDSGSHDHRCWRDAWQVAVRWSYADLTDSDILGGVGESLSAGVNWFWSPRTRFQFNCVTGNIKDHEPVDGYTAGHYVILGTRVMVDF